MLTFSERDTCADMAALLPYWPRQCMEETIYAEYLESLGGNLIVYHRIPWEEAPELKMYMGPEDWTEREKNTRRCWGAHCHCTACGEEWVSGWGPGGQLRVYQGPDGMIYSGVPGKDSDEWVPYEEGSVLVCPYCMAVATLVRKSSLKGSWTNQMMVCSVENAGKYTALVYWLIRRTVYLDGDFTLETDPLYAAVLDQAGELQYFHRAKSDGFGRVCLSGEDWAVCRKPIEPEQVKYYDRDAVNGNMVGAVYWKEVADQTGQTGEKTGLVDYIKADGRYPLHYLRCWKNHPEIENLVKAGWTRAISTSIYVEIERAIDYQMGKVHRAQELEKLFNWGCARPCDLLQMSKQEEREARSYEWDCRQLQLWNEMIGYGIAAPGYGHAALLHSAIERYGFQNILNWESSVLDGWGDWHLDEFDAYLKKQERRNGLAPVTGFQMLMDYREMLPDDAPPAELWPLDLRAAHDALAEVQKLTETEELKNGFDRILKKWGALDWTDGQYVIRLARSQRELTDEGRTLNHCVGRYGTTHIKEDVILFVRHYRRPERSWYTLNVDLRGREPVEVQLHGYGNERANGKTLHIPSAVRAVIDLWKAEVLEPVFQQVKAAEAQAAKTGKRKKKERAA